MAGESAVRIALLYPELLGTYGDRGNASVLVQRLRWRGIESEAIEVSLGAPAPGACDIYLLGGGEDAAQVMAASELRLTGALERAVEHGAAVLGVCAGFQILGDVFWGPDGVSHPGLGLLNCSTNRPGRRRSVGEILVEPTPELGLPVLTGFENHAGLTSLGPGVQALGRPLAGVGNGDMTEGAFHGRVIGTYLHGPVLVRNPALADLILSWFVDHLEPLDDGPVDLLRRERLRALRVNRSRARAFGGRIRRHPGRPTGGSGPRSALAPVHRLFFS
jgi:CobQ-like glutamine amidotransferase family enzyme